MEGGERILFWLRRERTKRTVEYFIVSCSTVSIGWGRPRDKGEDSKD